MRRTLSVLLMAGLMAAGCGSPSTSSNTDSSKKPDSSATPTTTPPDDDGDLFSALSDAASVGVQSEGKPDAKPEVVREKAVVGVGKKGRDYEPGMVTTPVAVYFRGPQMMVFNIQIPHAMKLYRGVNGHFPKSHEEFMQKIIKENQIQLPELPPGERYVYDPEKAAGMTSYDPADPPLFVEHEK